MNDTTLLNQLSLPQKALVFDLEALYACLQTIPDHRHRRGRRYGLATLLMIGVLAKLAGQDTTEGAYQKAHRRSACLKPLRNALYQFAWQSTQSEPWAQEVGRCSCSAGMRSE